MPPLYKILFSGKQAIGVEYLQGANRQQLHQVYANKEVLLCAGAIASPQILQRSGVGFSELLRDLDIELVHDLPGVGESTRPSGNVPHNINAQNLFRSTPP